VTRFRVWSTRARRAAIVAYAARADRTEIVGEHPLAAAGGGLFAAELPLPVGSLYKVRLGDALVPDPYARALPFGVHGPAEVMARETCPERHVLPFSRWVIYELHVGTFTPEGTYAAAAERLAELAELGVTAIELLPLASFPGRRGWGYDGVGLFAPHAGYGSPAALRAFVARAHALGLAVILDVVYNHFGPDGNYLAAYSPEYFAADRWTPWGQAPDFTCPWMRRLVLDNAVMWLREYGFDGLRLDATQAIVDPSPVSIVEELAATVRALPGRHVVIAEDGAHDPKTVTGAGLDAIWADDFHHSAHVLVTRERDGYYGEYAGTLAELARTVQRGLLYEGQPWLYTRRIRGGDTDGLTAEALVYCLQNHDQVGNRALGERLHHLCGADAFAALSVLLLFLPMTPLLWMGQEWAASSPWQYFTDLPPELGRRVAAGRRAEYGDFVAFGDPSAIPDPQEATTFARSVLRWDEREREPHRSVLALYRALLELRRDDPVLAVPDRSRMVAGTWQGRLWVRRWGPAGERLCVVDVGEAPDVRPPAPLGPGWEPLLTARGAAIYGLGGLGGSAG
jgi:maltooligosyltrehalose trehalohydrolase